MIANETFVKDYNASRENHHRTGGFPACSLRIEIIEYEEAKAFLVW